MVEVIGTRTRRRKRQKKKQHILKAGIGVQNVGIILGTKNG